jgi:hypothetical protein
MADGSLGASEKIVNHGHLVTQEHETIHEVRANETSSTGDKDTFARFGRQKFDGREARERRVGYRVGAGVIYGLGLVDRMPSREASVQLGLFGVDFINLTFGHRYYVVRAEVERLKDVDRDTTIETEDIMPDSCDLALALVDVTVLTETNASKKCALYHGE